MSGGSNLSAVGGNVPFIGGMISGIGDAMSQAQIEQENEDQRKRFQAINTPNFSQSQYKPEQLQLDKYGTPIAAQYQTVDLPSGTRDAQMTALNNMRGFGNGYAGAKEEAGLRGAMMSANQMAQARQGAISQGMEARGMGNSGLSAVLQDQAGQEAANRGMMGGLTAASEGALRRLQAAGDYNRGLGSLRNQDTDLASRNADILNNFNMYNTHQQNRQREMNTALGNSQNVYNTGNNNSAQQYNLGRSDQNKQTTFGDQMAREGAVAGQTGAMNAAVSSGQKQADANSANTRAMFETMAGGGLGGMGGAGGMGGGLGGGGTFGGAMGPMKVKFKDDENA